MKHLTTFILLSILILSFFGGVEGVRNLRSNRRLKTQKISDRKNSTSEATATARNVGAQVGANSTEITSKAENLANEHVSDVQRLANKVQTSLLNEKLIMKKQDPVASPAAANDSAANTTASAANTAAAAQPASTQNTDPAAAAAANTTATSASSAKPDANASNPAAAATNTTASTAANTTNGSSQGGSVAPHATQTNASSTVNFDEVVMVPKISPYAKEDLAAIKRNEEWKALGGTIPTYLVSDTVFDETPLIYVDVLKTKVTDAGRPNDDRRIDHLWAGWLGDRLYKNVSFEDPEIPSTTKINEELDDVFNSLRNKNETARASKVNATALPDVVLENVVNPIKKNMFETHSNVTVAYNDLLQNLTKTQKETLNLIEATTANNNKEKL